MEYYFPEHGYEESTLTVVPAASLVVFDWGIAFRHALCGTTTEVLLEGHAYLHVVEAEETDLKEGFNRLCSPTEWRVLRAPAPVQKRITINMEEWLLAAMQAKLSGERNGALDRVLGSMIQEEPVVVGDLDGETYIRPRAAVSQTLQALLPQAEGAFTAEGLKRALWQKKL